jgi:hypothetical protein
MNSSERVGTIRALWRYPVKSMLGEELDAVYLGEGDLEALLESGETWVVG